MVDVKRRLLLVAGDYYLLLYLPQVGGGIVPEQPLDSAVVLIQIPYFHLKLGRLGENDSVCSEIKHEPLLQLFTLVIVKQIHSHGDEYTVAECILLDLELKLLEAVRLQLQLSTLLVKPLGVGC